MTLSQAEVNYVNEILTLHMGPDYILVNISVDFLDSMSATDIENTIVRLDREIKKAHPGVKRVFVEAEARMARDVVP